MSRLLTSRWLPLMLSLASTILFLAFLEVVARGLDFGRFSHSNWFVPDNALGWRMYKSSADFTDDPAQAQVVLLGDSLIYLPLLENHSVGSALKSQGISAINLSGISYGNDQEFLFLQQFRDRLPAARCVFLNFCLCNDFLDNGQPAHVFDGVNPKPYFTWKDNQLSLHREHFHFSRVDLLKHSLELHWITLQMFKQFFIKLHLLPNPEELPNAGLNIAWRFTDPAPDAATLARHHQLAERGKPITRHLLQAINDYAQSNLHSEFVVLLYPTNYFSEEKALELSPELRTYFSDLHLNIYDLGCLYRLEHLDYRQMAGDRVGHVTQRASQRVAELIADYVHGKKLPDCWL